MQKDKKHKSSHSLFKFQFVIKIKTVFTESETLLTKRAVKK